MILHRSQTLWLAALLAMGVIGWDTALGPESGYWRSQPTWIDPRPLPPSARPAGGLRVLFIGNSFTGYWGGQVLIGTKIATSWPGWPERPPMYEQSTGSGMDLEEHWRWGRAVGRIREGNWDYVVLQDHSEGPLTRRQAFFRYARLFDLEIKKVGAKTVLFMTWSKKQEPEMQSALAEAYRLLGREINAEVVPVGLAFERAGAGRPALELHDVDGKHPSRAGSYLTACCFYRYFYGRSPVGLCRTIQDGAREWIAMDETDALYLQEIADRTRLTHSMEAGESNEFK